jgi:hypothetical protein
MFDVSTPDGVYDRIGGDRRELSPSAELDITGILWYNDHSLQARVVSKDE